MYEKATGIGQVSTRSGNAGADETDQESGEEAKNVKTEESEDALTIWFDTVQGLINDFTDKDWIKVADSEYQIMKILELDRR